MIENNSTVLAEKKKVFSSSPTPLSDSSTNKGISYIPFILLTLFAVGAIFTPLFTDFDGSKLTILQISPGY